MRIPTEADARRAVERALATQVRAIERFPTGLCHYVYDVTTEDGQQVVARLASEETADILRGGIYWHERLRALGVPLPVLLYADTHPDDGFPLMLLERLPGRDLGFEYATLNVVQKRALAGDIVAIQRQVASLPPAQGFGFALSYADTTLYATWSHVVLADLERSRRRIKETGIVDVAHVDRVADHVRTHSAYLAQVEPRAFLDDLTTKNVLVSDGALSGVVDVDCVCFGDPLFTVALTQMALLSERLETDYIVYLRERLRLSPEQDRALTLYTAVFCINFLSELGQRFNKRESAPVDSARVAHLEAMLEKLLAQLHDPLKT